MPFAIPLDCLELMRYLDTNGIEVFTLADVSGQDLKVSTGTINKLRIRGYIERVGERPHNRQRSTWRVKRQIPREWMRCSI